MDSHVNSTGDGPVYPANPSISSTFKSASDKDSIFGEYVGLGDEQEQKEGIGTGGSLFCWV